MTLRPRFPAGVSAVIGLITACAKVPSIEGPVPAPLPTRADSAAPATILRLRQQATRYSFRQTSTVQNVNARDSATSGNITTTAILDFVTDSVDSDGRLSFTVTADSLQIITAGSIPSPRAMPLRIGPVLRGSTANAHIVAVTALPDSLCAYSQLLTAAFQLVLPQLPIDVSLPLPGLVADTITTTSCRAGTRIELRTRRQLQGSRQTALALTLEEQVELAGAGMLRRDSIVVSGLITTTGEVVFQSDSRLPQLIQTQSNGRITVRLADSTTVFDQHSTQRLERRP